MTNFYHMKLEEDVDAICTSIRKLVSNAEERATFAMEEMKILEDEKWRDKELQLLAKERDKALLDKNRGFPISEDEEKAIQFWKDQHYTNQHNAPDTHTRIQMQGVSGGLFSYIFLPTSIGTSGVCRCNACYRKALTEVGNIDNYKDKFISAYYDDLNKAVEKYDAEFEFQTIG